MNDAASNALHGLSPVLRTALSSGITVVTPNNRLARRIVAAFDADQRNSGRTVWPAARVQPWNAWLQSLWLESLAAEAIPHPLRLLSAHQSTYLWRRVVNGETARSAPLIDAGGATELAIEAWRLVNGWGASGESWRGWSAATASDDAVLFGRWAERYAGNLAQAHAIDIAQAADALANCAEHVRPWQNGGVTVAGFIELTPQQQRLLAALKHAGMTIVQCDSLSDRPGDPRRTSAATPRDELILALSWARARASADPTAAIAIAVDDLERRRAEIIALAEDILCPGLQWPGNENAPRPYNLSYGQPLADVPIVSSAIDLIALMHGRLPVARAAMLARSPYLVGADTQWMARAVVEPQWIDSGQRELGIDDIVAAIAPCDGMLAQRWHSARESRRSENNASPREWVETWQQWLAALGWPGDRTLTSGEFQARAAWDEALAGFASLHVVESRLNRADALQAMRSLVADTLFQPEVAAAPVQILGLLEAAGQPFDALWVAGLAAERWPAAPRPHPLIPVAWQRERGVPHATAARELAFARAITGQLMRGAPSVVMSHAWLMDEHERAPSSLIESLPEWADETIAPTVATVRALFDGAPARECIVDNRAPAVVAGSAVRGGAGLVSAQSDCPFRAVAGYRLDAKTWPTASEGLNPRERGTLLHAALASFWRDVRDQDALKALDADEMTARIESAVDKAVAGCLSASRWRQLPAVVAGGEKRRLSDVVRNAIEQFDLNRPPFTVRDVEVATPLTLSGLTFRLFLDRVDALADGGIAIIDYKGGQAKPTRFWFDERPQGPQLAMYATAMEDIEPSTPVRAVAYAQLKAGDFKLRGLAADGSAWPELMQPGGLRNAKLADWSAVRIHWREALNRMSLEILEGVADVAPRDDLTCRTCGLQPVCRIGAGVESARSDVDE